MESNPLDCLKCSSQLVSPILLPCLHTVCAECSSSGCPKCLNLTETSNGECPDTLAAFLLDASEELTECCANCDQISQPMFFCETCQQCLCHACRAEIHKAKMFMKHNVIRAEDRVFVRSETRCKQHGEPFMFYDTTTKLMGCITCFNDCGQDLKNNYVSIDVAYKNAVDRIDNYALMMKSFQEQKRVEINEGNKLICDSSSVFDTAITSASTLCDQLITTISNTRDEIIKRIEADRVKAEAVSRSQVQKLEFLMDPVRMCLLASKMLSTTVSPLDVLNLSADFFKRVDMIFSKPVEKITVVNHNKNNLEVRSEFAKALEPYLGLSAAWCPISAVRETSKEGSGSTHSNRGFSSSYSYPALSGIHRQQNAMPPGSFANLFGKIEAPLMETINEMFALSTRVQEIQRDLTIRKCLVKPDMINHVAKECQAVEGRIGMFSSMLDNMQPDLQQIWQEHLDNVRKQQILYREKVDEVTSLRATAREVLTGARQLASYATCIEHMSSLIDPKRCHPPDPAPMESICQQISTIEPDSEGRIAAIEREEQQRRATQEEMRKQAEVERGLPVKGLKHGKQKRKDVNRFLLNTCRDRSPGGTDNALLAPFIRRQDTRWDYSSDAESVSMSETFDAWQDCLEADISKDDQVRSSSSLSVHLLCSSEPAKSPVEDKVYSPSTMDTSSSHQHIIQSLHHLFACQRDPEQDSNLLASLVKTSQKKSKGTDANEQATLSAPETKPLFVDTSPRKQTRRRKKRSEVETQLDLQEPQPELSVTIPMVPFVPSSVFEQTSPSKLGCFEAKEKVLQSLREKLGPSPIDEENSE